MKTWSRGALRTLVRLSAAYAIAVSSAAGCGASGDDDDQTTQQPIMGGSGGSAAPPVTPGAPTTAAGSGGSVAVGTGGTPATTTPPPAAGSGGDAANMTPPATMDAGTTTPPPPDDAGMMMPPMDEPVVCPSSPMAPGVSRQRIDIGGTSRSFLVQVPTGAAGDKPLPLVVDLHPLFFDGAFQQGNSGYQQLANKEGFLVAWPDGINGAWDIGPCCVDAMDEDFIRALVKWVQEHACVDPKRIYAAGYSMGGGMSHYLACNAADVFAATSPAAFDLLEENEMPCEPSRPITVMIFRGTADPIVPYTGGPSTPPNGYPTMIHFLGAEGSFKKWSMLDMCTGEPKDTGGGCKTYDSCAAGVEVTLCTATGGGHVTGDANKAWEMFKKHPKP